MAAALSRRQRGFSLVELLVVVAIIGMLAAILMPVFLKARGKAAQAACQSNLRQLGLAYRQYQQDYDERCPIELACPVTWPQWGSGPALFWYQAIQPYLRNQQVVVCPSDLVPHAVCCPSAPPYEASYAHNGWLDRAADVAVTAPADTVVLADGPSNYAYRSNDDRIGWPPARVHSEGWNVLYYDTHVKWRNTRRPDTRYHWANGYPQPNTAGF